jgi:ABC-2 type transport system permease protein
MAVLEVDHAMTHLWRTFRAMAYKTSLQVLRDKATLKRMITFQVMTFVMLAFLDLTVRNIPTVIVDQDHSAESRELVQALTATAVFDVKYVTTSTEQARGHIRAGRGKVAIVIPPDYARTRAAGGEARILALVDGSDAASSSQAVLALEGVAARINSNAELEFVQAEVTATVEPHTDLLYNPQRRVAFFMLPGAIAVALGILYSNQVAQGFATEREAGNLERLLMTPMSYTGLILGQVAPWFGLGLLNGIVYLLLTRFGFDVPIRGSTILLLTSVVLYLLTVMAMGAYVGAAAPSANEALRSLRYLILPSMMLSGYIFPISSLPKILLPISYAMPQTHMIEIMRGISLRGATMSELGLHLLYLVLAPIVLTLGAARRFSKAIMQ